MAELATEQHLNQVKDNINKDSRLNEAEKKAALQAAENHFAKLLADDGDAQIWANHCDTNLAVLAKNAEMHPLPNVTRLGNVWAITSFENSVARQLRCNAQEAKRLVHLACKPTTSLTEDEKDELFDAYTDLVLREASDCWLFAGIGEKDQPFENLDIGALPCRLGLPYRAGERFAAFSVSPPVDTRRPCVLNADWFFQKFWRPGGLTKAFCETSTEPGLNEWIATPPRLIDIGGPTTVAQVSEGNPVAAMPYDVP